MYTNAHVHKRTRTHAESQSHEHVDTHRFTNIHAETQTHTCKYTHKRSQTLRPFRSFPLNLSYLVDAKSEAFPCSLLCALWMSARCAVRERYSKQRFHALWAAALLSIPGLSENRARHIFSPDFRARCRSRVPETFNSKKMRYTLSYDSVPLSAKWKRCPW